MSVVYQEGGSRYVFLNPGSQWYYFDSLSMPLGSGAMGVVYQGYNYTTGESIAVKMIKPEYSEIWQVRQRARSEAGLTLLHPNIVRMIGLCEFSDCHGPIFILCNYVDGMTFDRYVSERCGILSQEQRTIEILKHSVSILNALDYVHGIGIIHRDVKPSNIMIDRSFVAKLMDLGIARFEHSNDMSEQGFIGTALYSAPETIKGISADPRADIYSMGVTIYELLAGFNPFEASSQEEILVAQLERQLPRTDLIPRKLFKILKKATAKDRNRRYISAASFAEDLISYINRYV